MMSDFSGQIFDTVSGDQDFFKKILGKIPGFKGYMESQARRDSDKLLRDTIYGRVKELENQISVLQRDFIRHGELAMVGDLEASAIKLRTFADRVRTAPRGYSPLFAAVKINAEDLAKIYEYDATLLTKTDEVEQAIGNVQASVGTDGLPAAIRNLENVALQCIEAFDRREEVVVAQ
jgi:hypothetical protein